MTELKLQTLSCELQVKCPFSFFNPYLGCFQSVLHLCSSKVNQRFGQSFTRDCAFPPVQTFSFPGFFLLLSSGFFCSKFCVVVFLSQKHLYFLAGRLASTAAKTIKKRTVILCYYLLPSVDSFQSLPAACIYKPMPSG